MILDPITLSKELMSCPSITPIDAGAIGVLENALKKIGFTCYNLPFGGGEEPQIENIYARIGNSGPNLCFVGHTDVVPYGNLEDWTVHPFKPEIVDGYLYGRGAVDMKVAVACFAVAAERFITANPNFPGSISFLVTGDEEGRAINGTRRVMEWMIEKGETVDACILGEPTSYRKFGDTVKIGRQGGMNTRIEVSGIQGHVACPQDTDNPVDYMVDFLHNLLAEPLDNGTEIFQPSNLEVTSVDVGNKATNVVPARIAAKFNIRYTDLHTFDSLEKHIKALADKHAGNYQIEFDRFAEPSYSDPGVFRDILTDAIQSVTGITPAFNTMGGQSDARFLYDICPLILEFGMLLTEAHQVDERVAVKEIEQLTDIYEKMLVSYFKTAA